MHADALFEEAATALRANRIADARDLFGQAGVAGRHDAAVIHCNLTASGGDWAGGLRLLAERILTMIVWLSEDYEGGETLFMTTGARLRGRTGDALLFRNALPDGSRDPASGHAGLPVTAGEKFIASRWIRARPFLPL